MPNINIVKKVKTKYTKAKFKKELPLHLMILPGLILVLIFSYVPMGGLIIAFQKFIPSKGMFGNQKWIGFDNFSYVFSLPGFTRAMMNTIIIAAWKIVLGLVVPIVFALLLIKSCRQLCICLTSCLGLFSVEFSVICFHREKESLIRS